MQRTTKVLFAIGLVSVLPACGDDDTGGAVSDGQGTTGDSESSPATMSGSATTASTADTDSATGEESGTSNPTDATDGGSTTGGGTDSATSNATDVESESDTDSTGSSGGTGDESGGSSSGGEQEICEAPGMLVPCDDGTADPFQAIGLNCVNSDPNTYIPIVNEIFTSADPAAWRIARQFGTYVDPVTALPKWGPREGDSFLLISTGRFPAANAMGVVAPSPGVMETGIDNTNPNGVNAAGLPAPLSPSEGSNNGAGGTPFINCDGVNDCSDSLWGQWTAGSSAANDMLWFQFETPVPGGTHGFSFDFVYFSAEFPEWVDTQYNDIFAVWSSSETYTGNLCFVNDEPCTVTALAPSVSYLQAAPQLANTGFDGVGQSTDWFSAQGSAEPGEDLVLTFTVFDMGDSSWDTAVIIDNFQWDCEGCVPSEVDPCIGIDPV